MDSKTFNQIVKDQPTLAALYRIQKQERKKQKNLLIKIKMQETRAIKKLSSNELKQPATIKKTPSINEKKKYKIFYFGNLFRNPDIN
jgi:hypothetical protein